MFEVFFQSNNKKTPNRCAPIRHQLGAESKHKDEAKRTLDIVQFGCECVYMFSE